MKTLETVLIAAAGTALAAWLLRALPGPRGGSPPDLAAAPPAPPDDAGREEDEETEEGGEVFADEPGSDERIAISSDGEVFIPHRTDVRVLALGEARAQLAAGVLSWEQVREAVLAVRRAEGAGMPGVQLDAGDYTAGRVKRGAPGDDPWRLELLGRDGELVLYVFETEDAAHEALGMLERLRIISRPVGEDGEPVPAGAEDWEEARRRYDKTVEELANMPEIEEPGEPR